MNYSQQIFADGGNVQKSRSQLFSCMQTNDEGDKVARLIEEIIRVIWVKVFFWTVTKCNSVVNTKLPTQGTSLKLTQGVQSNILQICSHFCVLERFHIFMQNSLYQTFLRIIRFSSLSEFSDDTKRH